MKEFGKFALILNNTIVCVCVNENTHQVNKCFSLSPRAIIFFCSLDKIDEVIVVCVVCVAYQVNVSLQRGAAFVSVCALNRFY